MGLVKLIGFSLKERLEFATKEDTANKILEGLSKDSDRRVRKAVARNPNTPPEILASLSKDSALDVREAVAGNPNTPPEVLSELSLDSSEDVRSLAEETIFYLNKGLIKKLKSY